MQPATYVVAGWPAAMNYFVMAAPAAQITCPATPAWFLTMYMSLREPLRLPLFIHATSQRAHGSGFVSDKAMTCRQFAIS
jgi:hypothetical protein